MELSRRKVCVDAVNSTALRGGPIIEKLNT